MAEMHQISIPYSDHGPGRITSFDGASCKDPGRALGNSDHRSHTSITKALHLLIMYPILTNALGLVSWSN